MIAAACNVSRRRVRSCGCVGCFAVLRSSEWCSRRSAADLGDSFLRGSTRSSRAPGGTALGRLLCRRPGRRERFRAPISADSTRDPGRRHAAQFDHRPDRASADWTRARQGRHLGLELRRVRRLQRAMGRRGRRRRGELQPHQPRDGVDRLDRRVSRRASPTRVFIDGRRPTRASPTTAPLRVRGGWAAGSLHALRLRRPRDRPRRRDAHRDRRSLVDPTPSPPGAVFHRRPHSDNQTGDFAYGYTAGLGVDICV